MKSLIRTPFKTLLTFGLLFLVMLSFSAKVMEYRYTKEEIESASESYRGVGWLEVNNVEVTYPHSPRYIDVDARMDMVDRLNNPDLYAVAYKQVSMDHINSLMEEEEVSLIDLRLMTPGLSQDYYRLDDGYLFYNYSNRFVIEATLVDIDIGDIDQGVPKNNLKFIDHQLLAGNPDHFTGKEVLTVFSLGIIPGEKDDFYYRTGNRFMILYDDHYTYDGDYLSQLKLGQRYVFIARYDLKNNTHDLDDRYYLGDHLSNRWCEAIQEAPSVGGGYLDQAEFEAMALASSITQADNQTLDVFYTEDLLSVRRFVEKDMLITQGRPIGPEDQKNQAHVCVVSQDFASYYGLKIGDKLKLDLSNNLFETYKGLGALSVSKERFDLKSQPVDLEIVGLYEDLGQKDREVYTPNWSFSINTVFVPKHVYGPAPDLEAYPVNHFSYVIEDAWSIGAFKEKLEEKIGPLEAQGYSLMFDDGGWLAIEDQYHQYRLITLASLIIICTAFFIIVYFVSYTYIGKRRKEFAIMRALGTPRQQACMSLLFPFYLLTLVAFLSSSYLALKLTHRLIETSDLVQALDNQGLEASLTDHTWLAGVCLLVGLGIVLVFSIWEVRKLSRKSPLALLQAQTAPSRKDRLVEDSEEDRGPFKVDKIKLTTIQGPHNRAFKWRYIRNRIFRAPYRSILIVLLSTILFSTMGQILITHETNKALYRDTEVLVKVLYGMSVDDMIRVENSGYTDDLYYEYTALRGKSYVTHDLVVTNDIYRYTDEQVDIRFEAAYDPTSLKQMGRHVFLGRDLFEEKTYRLGETINLVEYSQLAHIQQRQIKLYRAKHRNEKVFMTDLEILELRKEEIEKELKIKAIDYTVAGVVTSPSGSYNQTIFMPARKDIFNVFGYDLGFDYVDLTMADNYKLDALKKLALLDPVGQVKYVADTSQLEEVGKSLDLVEKILPLFLLLPLMIGAFVSILLLVHSSKEMVTMRVLGTPLRSLMLIFTTDQGILTCLGSLLGILGLYLNDASTFVTVRLHILVAWLIYLVTLNLTTYLGVWLLGKRKIFDQLQVKE